MKDPVPERDSDRSRRSRGFHLRHQAPIPSAGGAAESIRIHDLKNLACRLSALLQNLSDHYADPHFKDSALEVLRDTVDQINLMVSRYRRQPGQVIVKLAVDLNQILAWIVREIPVEVLPGIRIQEEYSSIPAIWGDEYYLRSALLSIVLNAVESMPSEGTLCVRTWATQGVGRFRVAAEIEDTGCGMSRSFVRSRLFSPFASTKPHGLGLGLYNARQIVDLHGGTIQVRSAVSRGTVFRLLFNAEGRDAS